MSSKSVRPAVRTALFLFALGTLASQASLKAQVLYGSITGNVIDQSGLPMPSTKVEALNTGTGVAKEATTDAQGVFLFSDLQAGLYKVTISAPGFTAAVQTNVQLEANTQRRVDVSLRPAQLNQSITVDATVVTLQADRVEVNTQLSDHEIEDLPMGGDRVFQSLLGIVPGVTPPLQTHSETGNPTGSLSTNVNGGSYSNNGTRVDGAVNSFQ